MRQVVWMLLAAIALPTQGNAAETSASIAPPATVSAPIVKVQSALAAQTSAEPSRALSPPIAPLLANADPTAGEAYAKKVCAACHSLNEGGKAIVGPNLYGVVGGPHAHMAGFNYSDALKARQGPWTYDELYAWLTKPNDYAPGTRMAFPGIKDDKLRLDVIAFLRTLSHNPEPLPAPANQ
jgi:cytochrome c